MQSSLARFESLCIRSHKFIHTHILQCDRIINVKLCNQWLCKYGEAHEPPRSCNHNDLPSIMVRLLVSCQAINRPILVVVISCDKARSPAIGNGRPMGLTNYVSRNLQIKAVIKLYVRCTDSHVVMYKFTALQVC